MKGLNTEVLLYLYHDFKIRIWKFTEHKPSIPIPFSIAIFFSVWSRQIKYTGSIWTVIKRLQ